MASKVKIGGENDDRVFLDTDFTRDFSVLDIDTDPDGLTAKDITGKTIVLDIRRENRSDAPPLKDWTLSIIGTFDSVASSNTQRARWTCADTDLTTAIFGKSGGLFKYSVKITNAGSEVIVQWGDISIERATQV